MSRSRIYLAMTLACVGAALVTGGEATAGIRQSGSVRALNPQPLPPKASKLKYGPKNPIRLPPSPCKCAR